MKNIMVSSVIGTVVDTLNKAKGPIFVVGSSRSGTTMMARVLGNHREVFTFQHELHFFEELYSANEQESSLTSDSATALVSHLFAISRCGYLKQGDTGDFLVEAEAVKASTEVTPTAPKLFGRFLLHEAACNGKTIPCDHTPRNVFYLKEILDTFPSARIISMIRDPRDVLLSQKRKWRVRFMAKRSEQRKNIPLREVVRSMVNYHPATMSILWKTSLQALDSYEGDDQLIRLRYEDFLSKPEETLQKVCTFLGISYEEGMLDIPFIGSSSEHYEPSVKGINSGRVGSWKKGGLNDTEVYICQFVNGSLMTKYGYAAVPLRPNVVLLLYYAVMLPLKLAMAFLFNIGRFRSIGESIGRRFRFWASSKRLA